MQADGTSLTRSEVSEIREKGFGQFGETKRGNFVIVDFTFTNNSSEAVTLDSASLSLIDSSGTKARLTPNTLATSQPRRTYSWRTLTPM